MSQFHESVYVCVSGTWSFVGLVFVQIFFFRVHMRLHEMARE